MKRIVDARFRVRSSSSSPAESDKIVTLVFATTDHTALERLLSDAAKSNKLSTLTVVNSAKSSSAFIQKSASPDDIGGSASVGVTVSLVFDSMTISMPEPANITFVNPCQCSFGGRCICGDLNLKKPRADATTASAGAAALTSAAKTVASTVMSPKTSDCCSGGSALGSGNTGQSLPRPLPVPVAAAKFLSTMPLPSNSEVVGFHSSAKPNNQQQQSPHGYQYGIFPQSLRNDGGGANTPPSFLAMHAESVRIQSEMGYRPILPAPMSEQQQQSTQQHQQQYQQQQQHRQQHREQQQQQYEPQRYHHHPNYRSQYQYQQYQPPEYQHQQQLQQNHQDFPPILAPLISKGSSMKMSIQNMVVDDDEEGKGRGSGSETGGAEKEAEDVATALMELKSFSGSGIMDPSSNNVVAGDNSNNGNTVWRNIIQVENREESDDDDGDVDSEKEVKGGGCGCGCSCGQSSSLSWTSSRSPSSSSSGISDAGEGGGSKEIRLRLDSGCCGSGVGEEEFVKLQIVTGVAEKSCCCSV
ncbi:hypothetical protein HK100_003531 [Physocladia obscura]|uniref:Uncharacterized protein n=1 Tax=Physocladia obscura TaxID=109957 RepID=A0AAD5XDH5_9FUNG|nr:hypothetical protein HK100_003531 [Physocladia obscura]